jgi:hypothetical protein
MGSCAQIVQEVASMRKVKKIEMTQSDLALATLAIREDICSQMESIIGYIKHCDDINETFDGIVEVCQRFKRLMSLEDQLHDYD